MTLIKGYFTAETELPPNVRSILSVDSAYYPGVMEGIHRRLMDGSVKEAYVIVNVYATCPGEHELDHGEGTFSVTMEDKASMWATAFGVQMKPRENDTSYGHKILRPFVFPIKHAFTMHDIDFKPEKIIKTSERSQLVSFKLVKAASDKTHRSAEKEEV